MNRDWWATVYRVAKSQTQLKRHSTHVFVFRDKIKMWYRRVFKEITSTEFEFSLNTMYPSPAVNNYKCMLCVFYHN